MKRFLKVIALFLTFFGLTLSAHSLAAQEISGFWKSIDDETGKPQSMVAIYTHGGKYYGRLILTYDDEGVVQDTIYEPRLRAPGVIGEPYYSGLDFIWDLEKEGSKYTNGVILDPREGRLYSAELWIENGDLIVRGEVFFLGRNQTWLAAKESDFPKDFKKPDLTKLVPVIPEVKDSEEEVKEESKEESTEEK